MPSPGTSTNAKAWAQSFTLPSAMQSERLSQSDLGRVSARLPLTLVDPPPFQAAAAQNYPPPGSRPCVPSTGRISNE